MTENTPPLVTIYLPTHNRCQLLQRAVSSVLKQTYQNIELIIVDDASSDETSEYLKALVKNYKNIRCFKQEIAKGACVARNIAINDAKGEFITGLDDDDELLPARIADLVANYDDNYAFVCTGFLWNYGKRSRQVDNTYKLITLDEQLNYNYATNQVFVATKRLRTIGGFDENFIACQDYDTWTRLIKKFGTAKRVAGASYIIHRGDDVERLTEPTNWLKGHSQFIIKHANILSAKNKKNQEFKRITVQRQRYTLLAFLRHSDTGLLKEKVRYLISSNFTFVSKIRRYFLE